MRIVEQGYEIIRFNPIVDAETIVKGARLCYKSETKNADDSFKANCDFIEKLIKNEHFSPLEHSSLSVLFTTNRGVSHELVRHRLAAYSQESTRYCNYSNKRFGRDVTFIENSAFKTPQERADWLEGLAECEALYFEWLSRGKTPEEARAVLSNDVKTEILVTANYREWRHILKLRTSPQAHYQMRELMCPLKNFLALSIGCVFGDVSNG